jgi:hypothetical protein
LAIAARAADTFHVKIGRSRTPEPEPIREAPALPGPYVLRQDGLLAPWYVAYRLDEEMERARRHDHPIAVIIAVPQLLPREELSDAVRDAAAAAATRGGRRYDLAGWLDGQRVIVVMPDTAEGEAKAAAERIRLEMWRGSTAVGGQKWTVVHVADARPYEDAAQFLASLRDITQAAA